MICNFRNSGNKVKYLSDLEKEDPEVKSQNPLVLIFSWLITMVLVGVLISILIWQPQVAKSMAELKPTGSYSGHN